MPGNSQKTNPLRWKFFNLVYLSFYFPEWMWRPPTLIDVVAIVVALALFIPLFFYAYESSGPKAYVPILAFEGIALALSPFSGLQGVFHIYACVQAGFQRPAKHALVGISALTLFYLGFIALTNPTPQDWINMAFALVFGLISGIGCMSAAESIEREQVRERSQRLERQHARLAERERIAHDLHDVLGHTLTMVALKSEVAGKLIEQDPERAREEIMAVTIAARDALRDIRETVYGMTVTTLDGELALAERALSDAGIRLDIVGDLPDLDARQSKALGMSVREATTNIVRHANATKASITITTLNEEIQVEITDNGNGTDDSIVEGAGMTGLRERIREIGGYTEIAMDRGMNIQIRLPADAAAELASL
ncbi:MAG: sensor histidine kinase [Woeseiaceae bacterium]